MKDASEKILNCLFGISVCNNWPDEKKEIVHYRNETSPPSRLVKIILEILYGKSLPKGGEKREWEFPIVFQGKEWIIKDWKRYQWSIWGEKDSSNEATHLYKKLKSSTEILNKAIEKHAIEKYEQDDISIENQYHVTYSMYNYFRHELEEIINKDIYKPTVNESAEYIESSLTKLFNETFSKRQSVAYLTVATSIFFFSLTEVIFDAIFSIRNTKNISFKKFRSKSWADRFKYIFNLNEEKISKQIYEKLMEIRNEFRNTPVHSSPELLISLKGYGLMDHNYKKVLNHKRNNYITFKVEDAQRVLKTFDECIDLFRNHPNTKNGYTYAESGFPIHFSVDGRKFVSELMDSENGFEEELRNLSLRNDAFVNMEI